MKKSERRQQLWLRFDLIARLVAWTPAFVDASVVVEVETERVAFETIATLFLVRIRQRQRTVSQIDRYIFLFAHTLEQASLPFAVRVDLERREQLKMNTI